MSTQSPGWYPAPDGNGQQWWNGSSWSDGRRDAAGSAPTLQGLPGYQAAPPPGAITNIPAPPPFSGVGRLGSSGDGSWIIPLVFAIVGLAVFNLFAVIALFIGIAAVRSGGPINRILSAVAILISLIAITAGVVSFVRGERSLGDIIF